MSTAREKGSMDGSSGQFEIDFPALIALFSEHLYRDKSAVIRELLCNASDALVAGKREEVFGDESPEIRIWLDNQTVQLIVRDNGIGMSDDDLRVYLATIGASFTKLQRAKINASSIDSLIGKFGVGFLSCFIVADRVVVETRKRGYQGYRWESRGERQYSIVEMTDLAYGTTVTLDLSRTVQQEWNEEAIWKIVLENARHFAFPIFLGETGQQKLNDLEAPWYDDSYESVELDTYRSFLGKYGDQFASVNSATEIIPLLDDDLRGVLYVPPPGPLRAEQFPGVELFCRRVYVTRNHFDILPNEFHFIRGIVDCPEFRLNVSRDDVKPDNYEFQKVRDVLSRKIMDHFRDLAVTAQQEHHGDAEIRRTSDRARQRLSTVLNDLHQLFKISLTTRNQNGGPKWSDDYVIDLGNFFPFASSGSNSITIPEYLSMAERSQGKQEFLIFQVETGQEGDSAQLAAVARTEGIEFLMVRDAAEDDFLRRYAQIEGIHCEDARIRVMDTELPRYKPEGGWQGIVNWYETQLTHPEFSLTVYLSDFRPETVAARLVSESKAGRRDPLAEKMEELRADDSFRDDPRLHDLDRLEQKKPYRLYLNRKCVVLQQIAEMLKNKVSVDLDSVLHPIFHDAAIAAGNAVVESHLSEYQAKIYSEVLGGLEARNCLKKAQIQLRALQDELQQTEEEAIDLRNRLDSMVERDGQVLREQAFFIRPFDDDPYDTISAQIRPICEQLNLEFIDPKHDPKLPGIIVNEIIDNLRQSRVVIADISGVNKVNVYYEAGFVHGECPGKLILIADESVVHGKQLPFDLHVHRVIPYNIHFAKFPKFLDQLETMVATVVNNQEQ